MHMLVSGGQRAICESWFSGPTMWAAGTKRRRSVRFGSRGSYTLSHHTDPLLHSLGWFQTYTSPPAQTPEFWVYTCESYLPPTSFSIYRM